MRKCVVSLPADNLRATVMQDNFTNEFAENFLGMFENALDRDDDAEAREQVLMMMQSLLERDTEFWREQITRLGVHEKVETLAQEVIIDDEEEDSTSSEASVPPKGIISSITPSSSSAPGPSRVDNNELTQVPVQIFNPTDMTQQILPEAKEVRSMLSMSEYLIADATATAAATTTASSASSSPITTTAEKPPLPKSSRTSESKDKAVAARANKNYQWRDWRIMHHNRLTYIWSDAVAFQLNEDGTVQYLMENKIGETLLFLTTQKVEDTDAVRQEFIRLFIETKEAVSEIPLRHIFEDNKDNWIGFGSWDFLCLNGVKLEITYSGAEQSKLEIFHDIPGFTYNFDADATETFMAEQMLSSVFATGWIKVNPLKQDRKVAKRERVKQLAQDIWEKYLKHCKNNMRTELKALQANAKAIVTLFKELDYGGKSLNNEECERRLYNNLEQVRDALLNDNTLSIFEIAHSGIVKALCYILANCVQDTRGPVANTFRRVFAGDNVINTIARKIVFVLEALEKFPVLKYDKPNSSVSGMKLLTRRFRFQLEQADPKHWLQQKLLNNTGRQMKADPLCSVLHLKHYLIQMLSKFWFDAERPHLEFVKKISECKNNGKELVFQYESNFDRNGIIYYLGTNGLTEEKWVNPATAGLIKVGSSDGRHMAYDQADAIFSRDSKPLNCHTSDTRGANFVFDLGLSIYPSVYTLRHAEGYNRSALRNWTFEGSQDNKRWYVISRHNNDESLNEPGDTASWSVNANLGLSFRFFRIVQQGYNVSGKTYYLSLSGFEIYGTVVDVVNDPLPTLIVPRLHTRTQSKHTPSVPSHATQYSWSYKPSRTLSSADENPFSFHHRPVARATQHSESTGDSAAASPLTPSSRDRPPSSIDATLRKERNKYDRNKHLLQRHSSEKEYPSVAGPFNNSYPPLPLNDSGNTPNSFDSLSSPAGPKIVPHSERATVDLKVEEGYPTILRGFNVRSVMPEKAANPYGRALTSCDNGRVRILWDSGESENVRYGRDGCYDVKVLANQLPKHFSISSSKTSNPSIDLEHESSSSSALNPSSTITQKSMSTTNLFDERKSRRSVASTNQAASAESLSHQTPSLENLLSRARLFHERIPEAGDEHSQSNTPEPSNNEQNLTVSVAASTFGGGSHPVLSTTRRSIDSEPSAAFSHASVNSSNSGTGTQQNENEPDTSSTRHRSRWAPVSSSQELFNEEDETELQSQEDNEIDIEADADAEEDEDDEYYVYHVVGNGSNPPGMFGGYQRNSEANPPPNFSSSDLYNNLLGNYTSVFTNDNGNEERPNAEDNNLLNDLRATVARAEREGSSTSGSRGGSTNVSRPSRFSNYADALRTVMQQVLDAGGHGDSEEIEDDILFNDEYDEEGTDETEEDIDEVITRGLASVVQADDSHVFGEQRLPYQIYSRPQPSLNGLILGESNPGSRIGRIPASDAARIAIRNIVGIPPRFYDILTPMSSSRQDPDHHNTGSRASKKTLRQWDDDFTLKPSYPALIPVFDPRPGRNNVNQTEDVELPTNSDEDSLFKKDLGLRFNHSATIAKADLEVSDLRVYVSGPNITGIKNATVEMTNDENKLLFYIQRLLNLTEWGLHAGKRANTKIWEPTYTLVYEVIGCHAATVDVTPLSSEKLANGESLDIPVQMTLDSITFLKDFIQICQLGLQPDTFISEKLTQKIAQELSDPLLVSANSLSEWCNFILTKHKHLFSLETRRNYLMATAFGTTRSIVWAQNLLDQANEQNNAQSQSRRDDNTDFRIGRLKHERIKVPRNDELFETAMRVLKFHAVRKSVLEIQYFNEEGTGLGPTLEFYALVAAEFQRKSRAIWICDDDDNILTKVDDVETDLGSGKKPPGYYVRRPGGLFPAPIPPNTPESSRACSLFRVLGIFLGKIIQDNRLVDVPLSVPLLKLLCLHPDSFTLDSELTLDDFSVVHQEKAEFIRELNNLRGKRDIIWNDPNLSREQRFHKIRSLRLDIANTKCSLDELGLTFVVDPPSNVFQYRGYELVEDGANVEVTLGNVDDYVEKVLDFHLNTGIRPQIEALRDGFNLVCPLNALSVFTPAKFLVVLCGDQSPQWTLEELQKYTVPKNGYTHDSTTFKRFIHVLVEMDPVQRKSFLQFATGCSSLPPGGLANLHPPLTIVRKSESGDGAYPSVNTCVHYLKVPDYSSKELLRERLLSATLQKGFYLN
jgi:hypothetical protein